MLARLFTQLSLLKAARIICVANHLKSALWWRKSIVTIIPSGVDLDHFVPGDRTEARKSLGWDLDSPTVIFNASRDPSIKRLDLATASVDIARSEFANLRFVVLDGYQDPGQIPLMMQAADCLLLTSKYEGSPNVVKEALACNLPVVTVDVGDVKARLAGVSHSFVVAASADAIAKSLVAVLRSNGLRSDGRNKVLSLGLNIVTQMVIKEYERLLSC